MYVYVYETNGNLLNTVSNVLLKYKSRSSSNCVDVFCLFLKTATKLRFRKLVLFIYSSVFILPTRKRHLFPQTEVKFILHLCLNESLVRMCMHVCTYKHTYIYVDCTQRWTFIKRFNINKSCAATAPSKFNVSTPFSL